MDFEEFCNEYKKELKNININIEEKDLKLFYEYMKKAIEWNEKINITAITDEKMFIVKHFVDSLTVNKYLENKKTLIDIGTGAGFPGIPLKILNKDCKMTLIDSVNKKLNVIRDITKEMDLGELEIIHTRAEDLANNEKYREKYDVATTRAVSNLTTILEYMLPFIKVGGIAICMKGPNVETELEESQKAINVLGGKLEKVEKIIIDDELERNIVIIKKIKNTPKNFPRCGGKPLKEPIR